MFRTPGGKPASLTRAPTYNAVRGVSSDGLRTRTFPVARQGAIFAQNKTRG